MVNPQIDAITLGVTDVTRAKQFYSEGLGCPIETDHGEFVSLRLGDGSSALALYQWDALAEDAGKSPDGSGFRGFTLSAIFDAAERVDEVLANARRAGGRIAKPARRQFWGGYSGYFADPDGYLWKVGSNNKPARRSGRRSSPQARNAGPAVLDPRETAVTLGVGDMKGSKQFYGDGLGCPIDKAYSKFVSFKPGEGSSTLALYRREALADDAGVAAEGSGFRGFALSNLVDTPADVDEVLARAQRGGGKVAQPAQRTSGGGYSGYFTDPDGNLWKVAAGE